MLTLTIDLQFHDAAFPAGTIARPMAEAAPDPEFARAFARYAAQAQREGIPRTRRDVAVVLGGKLRRVPADAIRWTPDAIGDTKTT